MEEENDKRRENGRVQRGGETSKKKKLNKEQIRRGYKGKLEERRETGKQEEKGRQGRKR